MRLDKFLKVSRIIKRRTVANDACSGGRVSLNGRTAKPGADVKAGDVLEIRFGNRIGKYRILDVKETVRKESAADLYEVLEEDDTVKAERG
ncbi:MAG: RNA-binding S4 domain-containing protein [Bacillota bacterium]